MSQNKKILEHIQKYGSISSLEAFEKYRITRLSGRIFDLREQGYNIVTDMKKGENGTYAVYRLNDVSSPSIHGKCLGKEYLKCVLKGIKDSEKK